METNPKTNSCAVKKHRGSDFEQEQIKLYADQLSDLTAHYRTEMRDIIRRYRLWRTSRSICEIRNIYLQAEGQALQDHMASIFSLYRAAGKDLQAMRRVARSKTGAIS